MYIINIFYLIIIQLKHEIIDKTYYLQIKLYKCFMLTVSFIHLYMVL